MREIKDVFNKKVNHENEFDVAAFYHENSEFTCLNVDSKLQKISDFYLLKKDPLNVTKDLFPFCEKVELLKFKKKWDFSNLKKLLFNRRTRRSFAFNKLSLQKISDFLNMSYGRKTVGDNILSTVPSGGALFPIHLYLFSINTALENGIYHYYFKNNYLDQIKVVKNMGDDIGKYLMIENLESKVPLYIVFTADLRDASLKYGNRAYRFALIEAGHIVQNMSLIPENMKWNSTLLGGFFDKDLAKMIGVNYNYEKPVYAIALGESV